MPPSSAHIIFACVHNAGRSQIAAAVFNQKCDTTRAKASSAGTQPANRPHPEVVDALAEIGIDISDAVPRKLDQELAEAATLLITLGCGEQCPYVPGLEIVDWPVEDPKGQGLASVRAIRDELRTRVDTLLDERGWRHA